VRSWTVLRGQADELNADHSYIVEHYSQLFDSSGNTTASSMRFGFQGIGEGWLVIMVKLCERLETIAAQNFKITGVKPKFGTLRISYRGGDESIEQIIDDAKAEALTTCEVCGADGQTLTRNNVNVVRCLDCFGMGL
jgi:hypothetical protein